jgi:tripartite-type tricarboxylate transporter receptor subunit TctC
MVGLFARVGTPPALVKKIADEAIAAVNVPATQKQLEGAGIEPAGEGTVAFAKYLSAEAAYVGKVIEAAHIKVE